MRLLCGKNPRNDDVYCRHREQSIAIFYHTPSLRKKQSFSRQSHAAIRHCEP